LAPRVSSMILDLARAKARVIQAGALTVPMDAREMTVARVSSSPTAAWRAENKAVPAADFTFDSAKLNARTLGILTKIPIELFEDAVNLGAFVEDVFAETVAVEIDRAALLGIGSAEEPLGLKNTPNVLTATSVGSPLYDDFTDAVRDIRLQNGEPTAAILSPRDIGTLEKLKGTANDHYLEPTASFAALNKLYTAQIPTNLGGGTNESLAFVGDFSQMWIGIRTQFTIEASREAGDSTGSAFGNLQVWLRGYVRADVAIVRPKFFCVLSGIL
jgi:HK97 family phage major capsid protein